MARPEPWRGDVLSIVTMENIEEYDGIHRFHINGESLEALFDRLLAESPEAFAAWRKPGGYLHMPLLDPPSYYTNDVARGAAGLEVPLFRCNCGDSGCGSITTQIVLTPDTVTWHSFWISFLKGTAPGVGPFIFDRRQYEVLFQIERPRVGLRLTGWHLGSEDEEGVHQALLIALANMVETILTGDHPLHPGQPLKRCLPTPADLEAYTLQPRDVYNFETNEVGGIEFVWWDESGPDDWTVTATIFYTPEGPRLTLASITPRQP